MKPRPGTQRGFTIVELVITVVVLGILMYALISIFITAGFRGVNVDTFTVAQSLAENRLEEVSSRGFDSISSEAETSFGGDLDDYSHEVMVDYVTAEALNAATTLETDYKWIRVFIRHSQLTTPISLEGIKTNY